MLQTYGLMTVAVAWKLEPQSLSTFHCTSTPDVTAACGSPPREAGHQADTRHDTERGD